MRTHTVRYMNPKKRHAKKRRSHGRRRRNPLGLSGTKSWKSAIPMVLGGAVAGSVLYGTGMVLDKYPQSSRAKAAGLTAGLILVGGIAAAMIAGPVAAAIVGAAGASLVAMQALTPAPTMTAGMGSVSMMRPKILPMGGILADNLGRVRPIGAVLADNLGAMGAGSTYRKHESKQVNDLLKKLGPRA